MSKQLEIPFSEYADKTIPIPFEETEEEYKQLEQENKELENELEYVRTIKNSAEETLKEVREENKKLKEDLEQFSEAYKKYRDFEKEELADSCYDLEKENKKLKERVSFLEECLDRKEEVNKKLREELSAYDREYFDEDKKAKYIFMEEDTLQELRDLGEI